MTGRLAIYPGSFDPPTFGHLDIIRRSLDLFDELLVAVAYNPDKQGSYLFTPAERVDMISAALPADAKMQVVAFPGLLVDLARTTGATAIVRGLRAVSDYEYELQMALMNRSLYPELETVFLMASSGHSFISSRLVREVASLGGNVKDLVPPVVQAALEQRIASQREAKKREP
jgi:pantetheine-phosphate adenylyltransferase